MTADPKDVKRKHEAMLLALPNVVALGVGPKVIDGRPTDVRAIRVFVSRKVPADQLKPEERIPAELDGVPVDVEEMAPLQAH